MISTTTTYAMATRATAARLRVLGAYLDTIDGRPTLHCPVHANLPAVRRIAVMLSKAKAPYRAAVLNALGSRSAPLQGSNAGGGDAA